MQKTIATDRGLPDVKARLDVPASRIEQTDAGPSPVLLSESDPNRLSHLDGILIAQSLKIRVDGQPMDVHGNGIPLPTRFELRKRLPAATRTGEQAPATEIGTGEGVLIGIVDSGIYPNPWLNGGYLAAPNDFENQFTSVAPQDPQESEEGLGTHLEVGHGTFATGLILQQAPAAGVWVERVLGPTGEADLRRVGEAAVALAHRGVDVLNLSLGAFAPDEPNAEAAMTELVQHLLQIAKDRGKPIVIVAAAGNLNDNRQRGVFFPAALQDVIAVGAVESPDSTDLASWSNGGDWLNLAAPGKDLLSTYIDGQLRPDKLLDPILYEGWAIWSGTSFAAAVVSGAIAHLMTTRPIGEISAVDAANMLRKGEMSTHQTEPEGDIPAVWVVSLRTWGDQRTARESYKEKSTLYKRGS